MLISSQFLCIRNPGIAQLGACGQALSQGCSKGVGRSPFILQLSWEKIHLHTRFLVGLSSRRAVGLRASVLTGCRLEVALSFLSASLSQHGSLLHQSKQVRRDGKNSGKTEVTDFYALIAGMTVHHFCCIRNKAFGPTHKEGIIEGCDY